MRRLLYLLFLNVGLFLCNLGFAQGTITGHVTSKDDNKPMQGVTVTVKGTTHSTITDQNGNFSIVASRGQVLQFSFVGYTSTEMTIGSSSTLNVSLSNKEGQLGEVVVTAYGMKRSKRELSYQAPVVQGNDIVQTRRENFINSLAGRVPGLTVTSTSGAPGASAQIILRGAVSISGNNQPLFVIDGVPTSNATFNQENYLVAASNPNATGFANRNSDYTNRIADINPEDIENVTILKGPEATALYGSDGASGAIVITTKKGVSGKAKVSYDNSFRVENVYRFPDIQTTYMRGNNGIYDPNAYNSSYGYYMFGPQYSGKTTTFDNLHHFFRQGFSQQHNLSLEAGSGGFTYRLSSGFVDQKGVVPNTEYQRMNIRFSGNANVSKKVNVTSSWAYALSNNDKASKGLGSYYTDLITWPIDDDIREYLKPDGTRKLMRGAVTNNSYTGELDNPFWDVNKNPARDKTDRLTGNIGVNYDATSWLNFGTTIGLDHYVTDGSLLTHPQSKAGAPVNGFLSIYTQNFRSLNGVVKGSVKKSFGGLANTFTAGYYIEDNKMNVNSEKGERFYELNFNSINNTDPSSQSAKLSVQNVRKLRGFATYTLGINNILFLNLSGTREGVSTLTSAFYDKQPFFNYWSASGSFVFSDLAALESTRDWLSYGKLRASYATTGKAPYSPYVIDYRFTQSTFTGGGYQFDVIGANPNLRPEFSRNLELGTELKFFKNRLGIDFAWYQINSKDQIISNRLSYGTGYVIKYINGGLVTNKGIEIQLNGTPVQKRNFSWDMTVNFDRNKGIVKKMPADLPFYYDSDTWLFGNLRSQVGAGLSVASLAGNRLQRNKNGDLIISPTTGLPLKDLNFVTVGDRNPDFKMGIINKFNIGQNWFLSFNLDLRKGGDIFNGNEMMMVITGVSKKTLDREQPRIIQGVLADGLENSDNPTRNTITINPYFNNSFYSSLYTEADFIEKVDWLRLRDATISYQIPSKTLQNQKILKSASLFVTGTDLFIITNYTGIDPNVSGLNATSGGFGGSGIDFGSIPTARGINFGIKAQF